MALHSNVHTARPRALAGWPERHRHGQHRVLRNGTARCAFDLGVGQATPCRMRRMELTGRAAMFGFLAGACACTATTAMPGWALEGPCDEGDGRR